MSIWMLGLIGGVVILAFLIILAMHLSSNK